MAFHRFRRRQRPSFNPVPVNPSPGPATPWLPGGASIVMPPVGALIGAGVSTGGSSSATLVMPPIATRVQ